MSTQPPQNKPPALFTFVNSTLGKVTIFAGFLTTIFTALKLFGGDTRLAIIVLVAVVTAALLLGSLYVLFKKREVRTATVQKGVRVSKDLAYSKRHRRAALIVLAALPVLWGAGIYFNLPEALTGKRVNIEGFVLTAEGEPADKALVTLFVNESAVETKEADGGKFSFTGVNVSGLDPAAMWLEVKWRRLEYGHAINLSADKLSNLIIKLPAGPPPFKLDYFVLEGTALDSFIRGEVDERWQGRFGGKPAVVMNDVYVTLRELVTKFSAPPENRYGNNGDRPLFLGGWNSYEFGRTLTREELISLLRPSQKWHLVITVPEDSSPVIPGPPSVSTHSFHFWRFATAADVNMVFQKADLYTEGSRRAAAFYSYLARNYLPPDFFLFSLRPDTGGPCSSPTRVYLEVHPLKLRVVLLENISSEPIRIGKFYVRENKLDRLRGRAEETEQIKANQVELKVFYPSEFLKPAEKLIIPIELLLAEGPGGRPLPPPDKTPPELLADLRKVGTIDFPVGYEMNYPPQAAVPVSTSLLLDLAEAPGDKQEPEKEFVFGPTLKIELLDVDGVDYPFRALNTSVLGVTQQGIQSGSCPYVFTRGPGGDSWASEGTILYGLNARSKEAADEKRLTRFDGSVLLREIDPETSFIDEVYVKAVVADGRELILTADDFRLRRADGQYLILKQGEEKKIGFDIPPGTAFKEFVLVAKGYYLPHAGRR